MLQPNLIPLPHNILRHPFPVRAPHLPRASPPLPLPSHPFPAIPRTLPRHARHGAPQSAVDDPTTHSYCLKSGTMPLLEAAVQWYGRRYGTALDPSCEALSLVGCQEGLAHVLMAAADPGDVVLMTDVAYPSYFGAGKSMACNVLRATAGLLEAVQHAQTQAVATCFPPTLVSLAPRRPCAVQVAGLVPCYLPLGPDFLPRLDTIPPADLARAKVLLLNYPNNPTAATATVEFFQAAVDLCNAHGILLVHDNPYLDLVGTVTSDSCACCPRCTRLGWAAPHGDLPDALPNICGPIPASANCCPRCKKTYPHSTLTPCRLLAGRPSFIGSSAVPNSTVWCSDQPSPSVLSPRAPGVR